jgi:hypothetical protein
MSENRFCENLLKSSIFKKVQEEYLARYLIHCVIQYLHAQALSIQRQAR